MAAGAENLVHCPHCRQTVQIPFSVGPGTVLRCPMCANLFRSPVSVPPVAYPVAQPVQQWHPRLRTEAGDGYGHANAPAAAGRQVAHGVPTASLEGLRTGGPLHFDEWCRLAGAHFASFLIPGILGLVLLLVVAVFGVGVFLGLVAEELGVGDGPLGSVFAVFVPALVQTGTATMTIEQIRRGRTSVLSALEGQRYLPRALIIELARQAMFAGPMLLEPLLGLELVDTLVALCFPVYLYMQVRLSFATYFLVDLGADPVGALRASWELTAWRTWRLIGVYLFTFVIVCGGALLLGIGLLFAMPYALLLWAAGYAVLTERVWRGGWSG